MPLPYQARPPAKTISSRLHPCNTGGAVSGSCVHTRINRQEREAVAHLSEGREKLPTPSFGLRLQCPLLWADTRFFEEDYEDTQWREEKYEDTKSEPSSRKAAGKSAVEPGKGEHTGVLGRAAKQAKLRHGAELEFEGEWRRLAAALAPSSQSATRSQPAAQTPSGTGPSGKLSRRLHNGQQIRLPKKAQVLVFPTLTSRNAVTVTNNELNLLDDDDWANDTIVDFHVLYIQVPTAKPHPRPHTQAHPTAQPHPVKARKYCVMQTALHQPVPSLSAQRVPWQVTALPLRVLVLRHKIAQRVRRHERTS